MHNLSETFCCHQAYQLFFLENLGIFIFLLKLIGSQCNGMGKGKIFLQIFNFKFILNRNAANCEHFNVLTYFDFGLFLKF